MNYLAPEICKECGGNCCQSMPGECAPDDFDKENLVESLAGALASGNYVIDWWEGDPRGLDYDDPDFVERGYYIRPRSVEDHARFGSIYCPAWVGQCIFWTPSGCKLGPEERPASCRMLEPKPDGKCEMHDGGGKHAAAMAWLPYHEEIEAAAQRFTTVQWLRKYTSASTKKREERIEMMSDKCEQCECEAFNNSSDYAQRYHIGQYIIAVHHGSGEGRSYGYAEYYRANRCGTLLPSETLTYYIVNTAQEAEKISSEEDEFYDGSDYR